MTPTLLKTHATPFMGVLVLEQTFLREGVHCTVCNDGYTIDNPKARPSIGGPCIHPSCKGKLELRTELLRSTEELFYE
jgi:hypothetical protein